MELLHVLLVIQQVTVAVAVVHVLLLELEVIQNIVQKQVIQVELQIQDQELHLLDVLKHLVVVVISV